MDALAKNVNHYRCENTKKKKFLFLKKFLVIKYFYKFFVYLL